MKIRVTWDGNADGASRMLSQRRSTTKLWVLVQDEDGKPMGSECALHAVARDTGFMRWLKGVLLLRGKKKPGAPTR